MFIHTLRTVNGVSLIDNLIDIFLGLIYHEFLSEYLSGKMSLTVRTVYDLFMILIFSFYSEECSNKAGTNAGSCASGFGVCCTCKWLGGIQQLHGHNFSIFLPPPSSPCPCSYWMAYCKTNTEKWLFVGLEFQLYL